MISIFLYFIYFTKKGKINVINNINNTAISKNRIVFLYFVGNLSYCFEYFAGLKGLDNQPSNVGRNWSVQSYNTSYQANIIYPDIPSKKTISILFVEFFECGK